MYKVYLNEIGVYSWHGLFKTKEEAQKYADELNIKGEPTRATVEVA